MMIGVNIKRDPNNSNKWIYGPLKFNCEISNANANDIKYDVYADGPGGGERDYEICDKDGNKKTLSGKGDKTFYIKIKKSELTESDKTVSGLSEIRLEACLDGVKTKTKIQKGYCHYKLDASHQEIKTTSRHNVYEITKETDVEVEDEIEWKALNIWIDLTKIDTNDKTKLGNVEFKIKRGSIPDGSKGKFLKLQSGVTASSSDAKGYDAKEWVEEKNATVFKTDSSGKCIIKNLKGGLTYSIEEVKNPNYGYDHNDNYTSEQVPEGYIVNRYGKIYEITRKNVKKTGNLVIEKKDKDSEKVLSSISFKIRNEKGYIRVNNIGSCIGQIHVDKMDFKTNEADATTFITDSNGRIEINNILSGRYVVIETDIGNNFGYGVDENYISWKYSSVGNETQTDGKKEENGKSASIFVFARDPRNTTNPPTTDGRDDVLTFYNKKKYIKLSGYAWEDLIKGKDSGRNNLYDANDINLDNESDKKLRDITVTLRDKDGKRIDQKVTNENGNYEFGDYIKGDKPIEILSLEGAYIEFEYNGMCYETTDIVNTNGQIVSKIDDAASNSSKVKESETKKYYVTNEILTRDIFNENFATITNNHSNKYPLSFVGPDNNNYKHKSELVYGREDSIKRGYDGQKYPVSGVYRMYFMIANTSDSGLKLDDLANKVLASGKDEIENINLGLREREQPDLEILTDVDDVEVTFNRKEQQYEGQYQNRHEYQYNNKEEEFNEEKESFDNDQRRLYPTDESMRNSFNTQQGFCTKDGVSKSYNREIYSSDIEYGNGNNLDIYITYKVKIRNSSTNLFAKVNEILFEVDESCEILNITGQDQNKQDKMYEIDKSNKIKVEQYLQPQSQNDIFVKCRVKNSKVKELLTANETTIAEAFVEITSYSTYSDRRFENVYAGIDKDSNPENAIKGTKYTYEDDTDEAPTINIKPKERTISGTVWEDNVDETKINESNEVLGNGQLDRNENRVKNVQVELFDLVTGQTANLYQKDNNREQENAVKAITFTDEKGDYKFDNVIPGKYIIKYTYGNNGEEKRSIICDTEGNEIDTNGIDISKYKSTMFRGGGEKAKNSFLNQDTSWYYNEIDTSPRLSDAKDEDSIIESRTNQYGFYMNYSKINNVKKDKQDIIVNSKEIGGRTVLQSEVKNKITADTHNFQIDYENGYDIYVGNRSKMSDKGTKDNLKKEFKQIDFGIIRRPKQTVTMKKIITYIEVTLANGQTIISGNPQSNNMRYVRRLPDGNIEIEIDNELIQGATLKIKYSIIADSSGTENDYLDENYYLYGICDDKENKIKMIRISRIYDYISNEFTFDENTNKDWKRTQIIEGNRKEYFSNEAYNAISKYNNIIRNNDEIELKPGQNKELSLEVSKLLSNNTELSFDNDIEIIELKDTILENSIPGNHVTGELPQEPDSDNAYLVITPPTGKSDIYTIELISIIISALITIGVGTIFIKKKVL